MRLSSLVLPVAMLGGCVGDQYDELEPSLQTEDDEQDPSARPSSADGLTTNDQVGAFPGFAVDIDITGEDVVLDWSGATVGGTVTVLRSTDAHVLADLAPGDPIPPGADSFAVGPGLTNYTDVGAAAHGQPTPNYFYRLVVDGNANPQRSTLMMKRTTAMAPGYNKFGMCMLEGLNRASDVAAQMGNSVTAVWAWDAVGQTYDSWTPAQGVGTTDDFALTYGSVFAAEVDGSTPAFQSLAGIVPTDEALTVTGQPGYNWTTLPALYDGAPEASYWVDEAGYWGVGEWHNESQSQSWYWDSDYADFDLEGCGTYYMVLPDTACTNNQDCDDGKYCSFVDAAACGDVAAGVCAPHPMGCEFVPEAEVCGCDGNTYANECEAKLAGASVSYEGACIPECPCAADPIWEVGITPAFIDPVNGSEPAFACVNDPEFTGYYFIYGEGAEFGINVSQSSIATGADAMCIVASETGGTATELIITDEQAYACIDQMQGWIDGWESIYGPFCDDTP